MKKSLLSSFALICICAVVALLLAVTNYITAPIIKEKEAQAVTETLLVVMPDGNGFEKIDISKMKLPETVTEAYKAENGGYVFKLETSGYSSGMIIMCGVYADGTVSGATCISSGETLGYEKNYGDLFVGKMYKNIDSVDTISGATKTTGAYRSAVNDAVDAAEILDAINKQGGNEE